MRKNCTETSFRGKSDKLKDALTDKKERGRLTRYGKTVENEFHI